MEFKGDKLSKSLTENRKRLSKHKRRTDKLETVLPGRVIETEFGEFYLGEKNISEFYSDDEKMTEEFAVLFDKELQVGIHESFYSLLSYEPEELVFLDIETTGLSNCPLFLVGIMYLKDSAFKIDMLFARDYSEEIGLIYYLKNLLTEFNVLVTFNGKAFDIPFIEKRISLYRLPETNFDHFHFDVLLHSRRKWRRKTPNCQLQTLEKYICGRRRQGDIPSAMIPSIYRKFVKTGNTSLLKKVFYHNALDLITTSELMIYLLKDYTV